MRFFPPTKPFWGTKHQPHSQGGHARRKTISYWTQAKITARYKKVVSTVFYFISSSLYGNSIPRKYSIFIQQLYLIYFIPEKFFPETREIGSLVVGPWEMTKNRETHGRTVRVGRSDTRTNNRPIWLTKRQIEIDQWLMTNFTRVFQPILLWLNWLISFNGPYL